MSFNLTCLEEEEVFTVFSILVIKQLVANTCSAVYFSKALCVVRMDGLVETEWQLLEIRR